jgi:hypothetical protein
MKRLLLGLIFFTTAVQALEVNSSTFEILVSGEQEIKCDEWGIRQDGPHYHRGFFDVSYYLKLKTCMKTSVADLNKPFQLFYANISWYYIKKCRRLPCIRGGPRALGVVKVKFRGQDSANLGYPCPQSLAFSIEIKAGETTETSFYQGD